MSLHQYPTPSWAAQRLVEEYHLPRLRRGDIGLDPTCGDGRWLAAFPPEADVFGVEIDPVPAALARAATGREVIVADIRTVKLPRTPTFICGNPPFEMALVEALLLRAHQWLPEGGICGLILPAYMLQTAETLLRIHGGRWEMRADHLPRNIFPSLMRPIVYATFLKGGRRLIGFTLYHEAADVLGMDQELQQALRDLGRSWQAVAEIALRRAGGEADLQTIYATVAPIRPTGNPYWRQQVRKVLRQPRFRRTGPARYALAEAA